MHIPLISRLAPLLIPYLSPSALPPEKQDGSQITFDPIHAFAHTTSHSSRPALLLHNASPAHPLIASRQDLLSLSAEEQEEHLLDTPRPDLIAQPLSIRTKPTIIRRPRIKPPSIISWALSAQRARNPRSYHNINSTDTWTAPHYDDHDGWEDVEVEAPDVTDRQTLIAMAKMASNAYTTPDVDGEWWPLGNWNQTIPFGWEKDADGLRGHVFADKTNSTVVIALKGTSAGVLGSGGPTAKNDKFNDNLFFSCCCARVDFSWTTVCDCYAGGYRCEQTCLEDALIAESVYSTVGTNLYNNVTYMYPNANIWLVGHSLGGSVAAMIGLAFGAPVVTFEAVGDRLPATRLHLPQPPGVPVDKTGITHVYHTADPIPMGACTGTYSGCYAAGFALESKCHTGQTILYDTVTVKGWAVDVRTHRIGEIINKVLADPWPVDRDQSQSQSQSQNQKPSQTQTQTLGGEVSAQKFWNWWGWGRRGPGKGKGGEEDDGGDDGWNKHGGVPKAESEEDCIDCYKWEFGDGWDKQTSTSTKAFGGPTQR